MKLFFLEALKKTANLPLIRVWQKSDFEFLFNLPNFRGIAVRLLRTFPAQEKVFVLNHPFSPSEYLSFINWGNGFAGKENVERVGFFCDSEKIQGQAFIVPIICGHVNYGEIIFLTSLLNNQSTWEWGIFCDQFVGLIKFKLQPDWRYRSSSVESFAPNIIDFLLDIHRLSDRADYGIQSRRFPPDERWFEEDVNYLFRFLSSFQSAFDLESVFIIQRASRDLTHVVVCSWADKLDEIDPSVTDLIEDILFFEKLPPLPKCRSKVFKRSLKPSENITREPICQSFVCEVQGIHYGHLGVVLHKNTDLKYIHRLLALLANHLSFRFAHLYQLRKEEVNAHLLQQINVTSNLLTASVDVHGIIEQLANSLTLFFEQRSGSILIYPPGSETLSLYRKFGTLPEGFNPEEIANQPGIILSSIQSGSAFRCDQADEKSPIRYVLPFSPTPQHGFGPSYNFQQNSLGCLILYNHLENKPLSDEEIEMLTILLNGVSAALLVALNYQEKLETIKSLEGLISRINDKDQMLTELINIIRRLLKVNRCSFLTLTHDRKFLRIERSYGIPESVVKETLIPIGAEISGYVVRTAKSIRIDNIEADPQFQKRSLEAYFNRSLLSVPLISRSSENQKKVIGVINVNNKINGLTFTDPDQKLLEAMADLLVVALENLELMEERRNSVKLQQQLIDAKEVQEALLPSSFEGLPPAFKVFGKSLPAREIGGDFFDAISLPGDKCLAAIGDVSGKGMPAAILMARIKTLLQLVVRENPQPSRILSRINQLINIDPYHFVTMQIIVVDPNKKRILAGSAGHGTLIASINGKIVEFSPGKGLPIGIHPLDSEFEEIEFEFNPGDSVLMLTDGLFEERTAGGEMFGNARIKEFYNLNSDRDPELLVTVLFDALNNWRGEREAHDDRTVLALKFLK
ncbi:MAG: SpoIIE family protein phosphatase [Candidatus Riflebacteria bacterium]|nr:SpoIIE family protein phosphatase [Candidatus Riflebacteria bacterium]